MRTDGSVSIYDDTARPLQMFCCRKHRRRSQRIQRLPSLELRNSAQIRRKNLAKWQLHSAWRRLSVRGNMLPWAEQFTRVATRLCLRNILFARTLRGLWGSGAELILRFYSICWQPNQKHRSIAFLTKSITSDRLARWSMLKQWMISDGKADSITVEEKYVRWTEELRSDKYQTAP